MMLPSPLRIIACGAIMLFAARANAQMSTSPAVVPTPWREEASAVGTTARVLIIGAHPDDEDNALIAWLSLGRHVETAVLSLTRGENGVNPGGREREQMLGMVRTAEALAERKRDGAHQYFTRAYDFGFAKNDSVAYDAWPRDSLLRDVVAVIRAFRPHVVITPFNGDTTDRDGQHQVAGQLARQAVALAGDTVHHPARLSSLLGAWNVEAFYQLVDSVRPTDLRVNVGEMDGERGRTYAELGADIRRLQRTQGVAPAPPVGAVSRYLRNLRGDSSNTEASRGNDLSHSPASTIFAASDTGWTRFAALSLADSVRRAIDSIAAGDPREAVVVRLARIERLAARAHDGLACGEPVELNCSGAMGDLALSLASTRNRSARALLDASGVVIDVTAEREAVAMGDTVGVTTRVFNGGRAPIIVSSVLVGDALFPENAATVMPDSVQTWSGYLLMRGVTTPWWLPSGLLAGTWIYRVLLNPARPVNTQLINGEDSRLDTRAIVKLRVSDVEVTANVGPIVARGETGLRGDERRPVAGVPRFSVLLEQGNQYAHAYVPFERLMRVWVGSALSHEDTVEVTMKLPPGLKTDSATRSIVLPAGGGRTLFFRVRGRWLLGRTPIDVVATPRPELPRPELQNGRRLLGIATRDVKTGFVALEYPHIATQRYSRSATDSIQAVDFRAPAKLRVAFIRGLRDEQIDSRVGELGVEIYPIDPSALGIADLSIYTTILIAPRAYAEVEALLPNVAAIRQFADRGGTVVVMYGRGELLLPGVLPFPIAFRAPKPITAIGGQMPIRIPASRSRLLDWPNRITSSDFDDWSGMQARELPATFDSHYKTVVELSDDDKKATSAGVLSTPVGKGMFIYTSLAFERQLLATNPGAARLFVNLLSASLTPKP
ncbi:MAG: PIG-L family deacetylase [bacterium]